MAAQSVTTFDLSVVRDRLGWWAITKPLAVETDGNPATLEFVVAQVFGASRAVVTPTADGVCISETFALDGDWTLDTIGGVTKYTRLRGPHYDVLDLPHPRC